jgi:hypothetical protein
MCYRIMKQSAAGGLALLILGSVGCATSVTGHRISDKAIAFVHPGVTTRSEIVENLGPPLIEPKAPEVAAWSWGTGKAKLAPSGPEQVAVTGWPGNVTADSFVDTTPYSEIGSVEKRRWIYCLAFDAQGVVTRSARVEVKAGTSLEEVVKRWATAVQ